MLLYRLIATFAAPGLGVVLLWRLLRGVETPSHVRQRLGGGSVRARGGIWIHGASNGELTSARALIEDIRRRYPDRAVHITSNTVTATRMVAGWGLPSVSAGLAPLDLRWAVGRVLRRWRPAALIVLENELWPNRIAAARAAGVPILCIGARMSARSARRWARFGGLARGLLSAISFLSAQDPASAERLRALGLPETALGPTGTLKSGVTLPPPPEAALAEFREVFDRAHTLLAASTHDGEEAVVLDAFRTARAQRPGLRLILAPRHPRRRAEIAALIAAAGLTHTTRSAGETPDPGADVYLADTMGEMALWYSLAGMCFVGGSLAPHGGHTPFEPAGFDAAILHGPHVENFAAPYAALLGAGAAIEVSNAATLADAVVTLATPDAQARMTSRAVAALESGGADVVPAFLDALDAAIGKPT